MNLAILTMGGHSRLLVLICLFALTLNSVAQEEAWTWKDRNGETKTRAELDKILADHRDWLDSGLGESGLKADLSGTDLRRADLSGADLSDAVLKGADLSGADLTGSNLIGALMTGSNLSGAYLSSADLSGADLRGADLSEAELYLAKMVGTILIDAVLIGADLLAANLNYAVLTRANLHNSVLISTNLSKAYLGEADLSGADLYDSNLDGAFYEPAKPPLIESIALAKNLDRLSYKSSPATIMLLKQAFKDAGYHTQHRQVIAAIRRHDASRFDTVMFDFTCEFGANPTRPLWIVTGAWLLCTVYYWRLLHRRKGSGLYLLATGEKINTGNEWVFVQRLRYRHPPRNKWYKYLFRVLRREGHALGTAVLFSLMSAFNIGFRELNFGRWIRMLQPREFDIKAHGIARVISGTQSLLSIYLVALAVLSYFGTPFDR